MVKQKRVRNNMQNKKEKQAKFTLLWISIHYRRWLFSNNCARLVHFTPRHVPADVASLSLYRELLDWRHFSDMAITECGWSNCSRCYNILFWKILTVFNPAKLRIEKPFVCHVCHVCHVCLYVNKNMFFINLSFSATSYCRQLNGFSS